MFTIEQSITKYLKYLRLTGRRGSAKTYGNHLRVWMRWLDDAGITTQEGATITRASAMADVNTVEAIAAFYESLKIRRKDDATLLHNNSIRSFQHGLRALWAYCCNQKMWVPDPMPLTFNAIATVPMVPQVANHRDHATVEQAEAMLDACRSIGSERAFALAYAVMQVLLTAGLRRAEMIHLEVSDYNREAKTLHVQHAKGGIPRTQRLDPETCVALDRWLLLRGEYVRGRWEQLPARAWHHVPDNNTPDFLFTNSAKRHLSDAGVTSLFRRLRAAAGLGENIKITPHVLRHLQATRIYRASGLRAAQKFLGHKSERTTWKYIRATSDTEMDEVLKQVQLRPANAPQSTAALKKQTKTKTTKAQAAPPERRRRFDLRIG